MRFISAECFFLFFNLSESVHALSSGAKTWSDLASKLPSANHPSRPLVIDARSIEDRLDESLFQGKPVLYLDRNRWDPNAQRAWLALEVKNADYVTVLVDDDYSNPETSNLPQMRWPDGLVQTGSDIYDILEKIQTEFPESGPDLYPQGISVSVDIVRAEMNRFDGIMLRYTKPSAIAPFIFRTDPDAKEGEIVQKFKYEVTLEEMEELLEEYDDGPFLAGSDLTAADIWYAPYLERFAAHLPLMYDGLKPRSLDYEALKDWYDAMDAIPCYSCRVKGRVETWQSILAKTHPELELGKAAAVPNLPKKKSFVPSKIWAKYAKGKPYLAKTPAQEVAAQILRQREDLVVRINKACPSVANPDGALLEVCNALLEFKDEGAEDKNTASSVASKLSGDARDVASFLTGEEGLSVPTDIGIIPYEALRALVVAAPVPRIS